MQEYLTIEYNFQFQTQMRPARRLTAEEGERYSEDFRDTGFVPCGETIFLPYIKFDDMPHRPNDGKFIGFGNVTWIIDQAEWDAYIALNAEREQAEDAKQIADKTEKKISPPNASAI